MQAITIDEMKRLDGEGFWGGLACGLSLGLVVASFVSPDPFTKIGGRFIIGMAIAACGAAFA